MSLIVTLSLAFAAGLSIPMGAFLSSFARLDAYCRQKELDSFVSYFGGGALIAAITLVLIPHGMEHLSVSATALVFLAGGLLFWQVTVRLKRSGSSASQLTGMMLDFIPEAIMLGAASTDGSSMGYLLAALIGLQNMPEGFASFRELKERGLSGFRLWGLLLLAPLAGPVAALLGHVWLGSNEQSLSIIVIFCSGGILYLIFDDIAPEAHLKNHEFPATGALLGFLLGMIGTMLVH